MATNVAPLSLSVTRGEDRSFGGTHQTSGSDPTPINISGWTIVFTVRDTLGAPVLTKSGTVTSGPSGTYTFSVAASDTSRDPRTYPCDIWRTDSGNATIMGLGTFTIGSDIRV